VSAGSKGVIQEPSLFKTTSTTTKLFCKRALKIQGSLAKEPYFGLFGKRALQIAKEAMLDFLYKRKHEVHTSER